MPVAIIILIIILFMFLIMGGVGFYMYNNQKKTDKDSSDKDSSDNADDTSQYSIVKHINNNFGPGTYAAPGDIKCARPIKLDNAWMRIDGKTMYTSNEEGEIRVVPLLFLSDTKLIMSPGGDSNTIIWANNKLYNYNNQEASELNLIVKC